MGWVVGRGCPKESKMASVVFSFLFFIYNDFYLIYFLVFLGGWLLCFLISLITYIEVSPRCTVLNILSWLVCSYHLLNMSKGAVLPIPKTKCS